jgi:hypothetical protein
MLLRLYIGAERHALYIAARSNFLEMWEVSNQANMCIFNV